MLTMDFWVASLKLFLAFVCAEWAVEGQNVIILRVAIFTIVGRIYAVTITLSLRRK